MASAILFLCLMGFLDASFSQKQTESQPVGSSSGQIVTPSVLGSLLTFSQRLSDMERLIKSHDKKILEQEETIENLKRAVKEKASMLDVSKVKNELQNNVAQVMQDVRIRTREIERYRSKLRTIESAYSTTDQEFALTRGKVLELEDRFGQFSANCRTVKTGWRQRANGEIMFLDRHHVRCRNDELLQSFQLARRSDYEDDMVRYVYRCCRLTL
ncbi:predicted protein [Nematostella vectensis]|uniref:Uncharacterized protein n=1 Tax=Nematostella vectensis TaxID=45351 RepID=A7S4V4_NEMVE|nr:predicted protein [Nematostella vectensis]|eukprot:XP_001633282.1 predicted protein [Nematostella vectensis]